MPRFALHVVLCLLVAAPAWASSALEAARADSAAARSKVAQTRKSQTDLRRELSDVSARIEQLKAKEGRSLLENSELETALRHSQELSAQLTELANRLSTEETASQSAAVALLSALNAEVATAREQAAKMPSRDERKALLAQLSALKAEREQLRSLLPDSAIPQLQERASTDPDELLSQADALRDNEDKVRAKVKELEARLADAKQDRDLDRHLRELSRDESLFDDADRRIRLEKDSTTLLKVQRAPPLAGDSRDAAAPQMAGGATGSPSAPSSAGFNSGDSAPVPATPPNQLANSSVRAEDKLPVVGQMQKNPDDDADVQTLELELKRLNREAHSLDERAAALEEKAKTLQ